MKNLEKIDVDNPHYSFVTDPISSHSRIAEFYKFRPPYSKRFFEVAAKKLNISRDSVLLDLCCGRGELASEFAGFSKSVFAVDGSAEMLSNKISRENVTYIQGDVNQEEFMLPYKVDHVVIGSSIHWVKQSAIQKITAKNLNSNGMVLVSHTSFIFNNEAYGTPMMNLNAKFGGKPRHVDFGGVEKMHKSGYQKIDYFRLVHPVQFGIEYLYNNQLSYLYHEFYDNVMSDISQYKREFMKTVSPFSKNGELSAKLANWAVIYAPK